MKALSEVVHMVIQDKWVFLPPEKKNVAQMQGLRKNLKDIWEILIKEKKNKTQPLLYIFKLLQSCWNSWAATKIFSLLLKLRNKLPWYFRYLHRGKCCAYW